MSDGYFDISYASLDQVWDFDKEYTALPSQELIEESVAKINYKNIILNKEESTVFLKAKRGEVDAVVTMYHDQGQIAIKLMGFERGVTVAGGLPIPIATPAHGTAFDIAGQGIANVGATRQAFDLLVRMSRTARNEATA